jgi:hypothetical protein
VIVSQVELRARRLLAELDRHVVRRDGLSSSQVDPETRAREDAERQVAILVVGLSRRRQMLATSKSCWPHVSLPIKPLFVD